MEAEILLLLDLLEEAYQRRSWHGPNLRGSLRGLSAREACWRPSPGRHNIWEVAVHAAYWKYAVRRLITGDRRGSFGLKGSNWIERPGADGKWRDDLRLLSEEHARLAKATRGLSARDLTTVPKGSTHSLRFLITGAASHDLYHAGQIQLLKRLMKDRAIRQRTSAAMRTRTSSVSRAARSQVNVRA